MRTTGFFPRKTLAAAVACTAAFTPFTSQPVSAEVSFTLEEVIVTARKRDESLMDTPVAVVAVSGESMDEAGMTNLEQLSGRIPGLQLGRSAQTSSVFIRGIGSGVTKSFEQSAGMYLDGVYQSRSRAFSQSMVDLQQVEVLKGPQGILFGKNTIAGAIKVETATPVVGDEFSATLAADLEAGHDLQRSTLVMSGSVTDELAARVALRYQEADGYVENHLRNAQEQAKEDSLVRLSLAWEPTDTLSVITKLSQVKGDGEGADIVNPVFDDSLMSGSLSGTNQLPLTSVLGAIATASVADFTPTSQGDGYSSWVGNTGYQPTDIDELESTQFSVKVDWDLSEQYTFSALSAYSDFEFSQDHDIDFSPANVIQTDEREENELFSQEFRLASNFDGPLNFVTGVYYEQQELVLEADTFVDGTLGGVVAQLPAASFIPGAPGVLGDYGINSVWNGAVLALQDPAAAGLIGQEIDSIVRSPGNYQDSETLAIFLEVNYDVSETVSLELGVRYSEDVKEMLKTNSLSAGAPGSQQTLINADGTPTEAGLLNANTELLFASQGLVSTVAHSENLRRTEYHLDPSAKLLWNATDETLVYLSYSQGYKSGGFNSSPDGAFSTPTVQAPYAGSLAEDVEFDSEEAAAWELGVKSTLWDGRARLAATLFMTEISDLQVASLVNTAFTVGNAAELTSKGFELEGQLAASESLELSFALAYLDSEFGSYSNAPCTVTQLAATAGSCSQDLAGRRATNAPEWSGTLGADHSLSLSDGFELRTHMDINYKGEMYLDGDLDPNTLQDAYVKVNARLALAPVDDSWEVALYARNLTNEVTHSFISDSPLGAGIYFGTAEEPRIVGIHASYNF